MKDRTNRSTHDAPVLLYVAPSAKFFLSHRAAIAAAAAADGYSIAVACPTDAESILLGERGFRHIALPLDRSGMSPLAELRTLISLCGIFRHERPVIAHLITAKAALHGGLAARFTHTPSITAVTGLGFLFMRSTARVRLIQNLLLHAYRLGLRRRDNHFIFQNDDDRQAFSRFGLLDRSEATILPGSGVDLQAIRYTPMPCGIPQVLMPCRMLRDKGVDEFVAAATILKSRGAQARFCLLGDPDPENPASLSRDELMAINSAGVVEWRPFTADIGSALADASIVALPSYREGFPKTLIDAAAAGRPMVTTDVPGCRDAVRDAETGLICLARDARSLADALGVLIDQPALREQMSVAARADAELRFDIADTIRTHLALYRRYRRGD